ncbi:MAG: hypothetical protein O7C63_02605, partial [Alphaproteobacteria bacterium]|nr:hypothetical protein [Alphaproteobacteria bacterium]
MRGVTVLLALTVALPALAAEEVWLAAPDDCLIWVDRSLDTVGVDWNGGCKDGRADGDGTLVWHILVGGDAATVTYRGHWRDGRLHGQGAVTWANGAHYQGRWRDGQPNGRGAYVWSNGDRYEGDFRDGNMHGDGVK